MRLALDVTNVKSKHSSCLVTGINTSAFIFRFGNQFDKRVSASTYTRSAVKSYNMGNNSGKMSGQGNIKNSKEISPSHRTEVDRKRPKKELPKLTPAEFRVYNRLAERMDYFVRIKPSQFGLQKTEII